MIDFGLYFMYALLIVAILTAVGLPLINALKSPAQFFKSLIGVLALVVLFGICYAISDATVKPTWAAMGLSSTTVKLVGAGLLTFYTVIVLAVIGLIFSEINKAIN